MTRIISGRLGGRTLSVPKSGTRPTSDRVREAIFSRLDHAGALREARVLDLFAGSGALGLEALSRGASHATFVEHAAPAAKIITANIASLGTTSQCTVVRERVQPYLDRIDATWDVVFADPPYDIAADALGAVLACLTSRVGHGGQVILEVSSRAQEPHWPEGLTVVQTKVYGETTVHTAEPVR